MFNMMHELLRREHALRFEWDLRGATILQQNNLNKLEPSSFRALKID